MKIVITFILAMIIGVILKNTILSNLNLLAYFVGVVLFLIFNELFLED